MRFCIINFWFERYTISIMNYFVYILKCINGSFYTGYTNDLAKRYKVHLMGNGAKYTRSFKPVEILQSWCTGENKRVAMQIEAYIKKLSRAQKIKLIQQPSELKDLFELKEGACNLDSTKF